MREPRVLGSRVPDGTPVHVTFRLDPESARILDQAARHAGLERNEFIRQALRDAVRVSTGGDLPTVTAT